MKKTILLLLAASAVLFVVQPAFCAYHHEGEQDAAKFLTAYPEKAGTKLDHCALCHTGGSYVQNNKTVSLGSCQWCHYKYKYDGSGNILETMNPYGKAYKDNGEDAAAVAAIDNIDSDSDGYANQAEIPANRFPGNPNDDPSKVPAPYRVYNRLQLEGMTQHTQFLLMNTSRSGDFYAEYTGVVLEDLLADAGIIDNATGITVFSPDGWAQYHPLQDDPLQPEFYPVVGAYPDAVYYYDEQADIAVNLVDGWCNYSAPSCTGRNHNDNIVNPSGNKVILAYRREGALLDTGALTNENKLDGEGPFRVVPPQKNPNAPDQSSKASNQAVIWPYNFDWDHNAGASTRTVTMIRVEPLPEGTTDIDILEAGWSYVDQEKVIIYGAIDGDDANSNGIGDIEEGGDNPDADYDNDGQKNYQDRQTARFRHGNGNENIILQADKGNFAQVQALYDLDPVVPQTGRPANSECPYGVINFQITGLTPGASVVVTIVFPDAIPTGSGYFKISSSEWQSIPMGSNNGDNTITITLTDGDPVTDADGTANGVIVDPSTLILGEDEPEEPDPPANNGGGGGGGCFIQTIEP